MSEFGNQMFLLFIALMAVATYTLIIYPRQRKEKELSDERNWERERIQREITEKNAQRQSEEMKHLFATVLAQQTKKEKSDEVLAEAAVLNSGGYIIFDMPESKKSLFHDLLKGFEDYAKLQGYVISFSIDNSFPNKVAFKFTLDGEGVTVSTKQVRKDLKEYIERVQSGDSLDNLPVIISKGEHELVLTHMKNRISLLQHNYALEKNAKEFYMGLLKQIPQLGVAVTHPQNFYIGDSQKNQHFIAQNSPQAAIGMGNEVTGNANDENIYIANSFNEREQQVSALNGLWVELFNMAKAQPDGADKSKIKNAENFVHKAAEEMKDGEPPEKTRLTKWLTTAKDLIGTLALTESVHQAAVKVWELFHM